MRRSARLLPLLLIASTLTVAAQSPATPAAWRTGTSQMLFDGASLGRWISEGVRDNTKPEQQPLPDVIEGAMRLTARFGWTRTTAIYRNFRLAFGYRAAEQGSATVYFRTWPRLDKTGRPVNGSSFTLPATGGMWRRVVVDCRNYSAFISVDGKVIAVGNDLTNSAGYIGFRGEAGSVDIRDVVVTPVFDDTRKLAGNRDLNESGIQSPKLVHEVKPQYTADAMRERIQGGVWMEVRVLEDGTVGDVVVVESLDPVFGLDDEAMRAVKGWRFQAATREGTPVRMVVSVEMAFTLK